MLVMLLSLDDDGVKDFSMAVGVERGASNTESLRDDVLGESHSESCRIVDTDTAPKSKVGMLL